MIELLITMDKQMLIARTRKSSNKIKEVVSMLFTPDEKKSMLMIHVFGDRSGSNLIEVQVFDDWEHAE